MPDWRKVEDEKPLPDNVHGHRRCITYWPMMALDEDGDMTTEIVGGRQHIVDYEALGAGGSFEDPDCADACGDWFGDDYCYAQQPSHWAPCLANPDGSDTSTKVTHIDCLPVDEGMVDGG
jgi:hypothetical protein